MDFEKILRQYEGELIPHKVYIRIADAENKLRDGLEYFVGHFSAESKAQWIEKSYRPIVDWMTDNKGRGLLMLGKCGLGKTLIGKHILPLLLRTECGKYVNVVNAQELNKDIDKLLELKIVYVDDLGTESVSKSYGNVRNTFSELVDAAEQQGKLLLVSTNLTTRELADKYGERTLDRLRAITKFIPFVGQSMRR